MKNVIPRKSLAMKYYYCYRANHPPPLIPLNLAVLDFWEFYGPDEMRAYMYDTAKEAGWCDILYL